ncbi:MAG: patatin-like phospholipase family protein [Bacteroidales bacterium]
MKAILSIDGGGVRGILPASIVAHIERRVQQKSGNSNARIAYCFDLFGGTSAGGILTALYLTPSSPTSKTPKYSATQILELYSQMAPQIFSKKIEYRLRSGFGLFGSRYNKETLYRLSKEIIGDSLLSEALAESLITAYDLSNRKALLFTKNSTRKYGDMADYRLRDIACATSAAPSYFAPANIKAKDGGKRHLIDGGIYASNPTMCTLVDAFKIWPNTGLDQIYLLSLGCGKVVKPYHPHRTKRFGYIHWLNPVLDLLISSVAETTDHQVMQLFRLAHSSQNYIRVEPSILNASSRIDNAKPENMRRLLAAAGNWIDHNGVLIEEISNTLVEKLSKKELYS